MLLPLLLLPTIAFALFTYVEFFRYLSSGAASDRVLLPRFVEGYMIVLLPLLFLFFFDLNEKNDCCSDSAVFAPAHRAGIYILIGLCIICYSYSALRRRVAPPVPEVLVNCLLVIGILINVFLTVHLYHVEGGIGYCALGTVPIMLLLWMRLHRNQIAICEALEISGRQRSAANLLGMLFRHQGIAAGALLLLAAPLTALFSALLNLFGQDSDSLSRAFTETYKHGLSRLDYECANVNCGGHYLCSVAALGHPRVVRPIRYGVRRGGRILCNRQLLVANAFEELVSERTPALHRAIRKRYDRVGELVHRHYGLFRYALLSDAVYVLMKPLEWIFLLALYCLDRHPECRIARQYSGDLPASSQRALIS